MERATLLSNSFRRGDLVGDPDTYLAAIAAVLSDFDPDIVGYITDPRTGMASEQDIMPTIYEVRQACNRRVERLAKIAEGKDWQERVALTNRLRAQGSLAAYRGKPADFEGALPDEKRPTYAELKAKYGPNWGLSEDARPKLSDEEQTKRDKAFLDRRDETILRQYKAAGLEPVYAGGMLVSLSMIKLLEAQMKCGKDG